MINLFVNYYVDKNDERDKELKTCMDRNLWCESINKIFVIGEPWTHENTFNIPFSTRPTFRDFFNIINRFTQPNDINIIANSDIYFNELSEINIGHNDCYALSRWDIQPDGSAIHYNNPSSQDTWIFRGAIKMVENCSFMLGVPGCDNKIAYQLQQAGYRVTNPSLSIKTYHLHLSNVRRLEKRGGKIFRLPRPYLVIHSTELV